VPPWCTSSAGGTRAVQAAGSDLGGVPSVDVEEAIAGEDAQLGKVAWISHPQQHDPLVGVGDDELANPAPLQPAPALVWIVGAEQHHDQFCLVPVKPGQVHIQIGPGQLGLMKRVEQHSLPAAASRQLFCQRGNEGAIFACVGESHREAGAVLLSLMPHYFGLAKWELWQGLRGSAPAIPARQAEVLDD